MVNLQAHTSIEKRNVGKHHGNKIQNAFAKDKDYVSCTTQGNKIHADVD